MTIEQTAIKTTYFSIFGNASLALIKGLAGVFGNSYALIADAIESTTDIFSSFMVLLGLKYANRPPDEKHPYGHGRAESLVTFIVVGLLISSATIIGFQSIDNIANEHEMPKPWTLFVLAGIIIWKEISFQVVIKKSKETHSSALKADAWHHRSDAITSVAAFIGIALALILGPGYENLDDWAALSASAIILYNSYLILRPALGEMMDEQLYDDLIKDIRRASLTVDGILDTEKCYIRKSGMRYHIDLHIVVDANITVKAGHYLAHQLKDVLRTQIPNTGSILIHVEPND